MEIARQPSPGRVLRRQRERAAERTPEQRHRQRASPPREPELGRARLTAAGVRLAEDGTVDVDGRILVLHHLQQPPAVVQHHRPPGHGDGQPSGPARIDAAHLQRAVRVRIPDARRDGAAPAPRGLDLLDARRGPPQPDQRHLQGGSEEFRRERPGRLRAVPGRQQLHAGPAPRLSVRPGPSPAQARVPVRLRICPGLQLRLSRQSLHRGSAVHTALVQRAADLRLQSPPAQLPEQEHALSQDDPGTRKRQDDEYTHLLRVEVPVGGGFTVGADYQGTNQRSNLAPYTYTRSIYTLSVSYTY